MFFGCSILEIISKIFGVMLGMVLYSEPYYLNNYCYLGLY